MILDYLDSNQNFGMNIVVSPEEVLLDTGGGLKQAAYFFLEHSVDGEEPCLLYTSFAEPTGCESCTSIRLGNSIRM